MKKYFKQFSQGAGDNSFDIITQNGKKYLVINNAINKTNIKISKAHLEIKKENISAGSAIVWWDKTGALTDFSNIENNPNAVLVDVSVFINSAKLDISKAIFESLKANELENERFIIDCGNVSLDDLTCSITVYYDDVLGLKDTKATLPFELGVIKGGIDLADKSMQFELVDTMGAGRLPVSVKHMYNSLRTTYYDFVTLDNGGAVVIDYKCGNGFKLNYQQFLVVDSVDSGTLSDGESDVQYIWINANGEKITFYKNATTGKVTCEHNFTLTLDNDGIIEISDLSNNKLEFEQVLYSRIYRLKRMIDVNSNKIVLTYNEFEDLSEIQSFTNNGSTDVEINKVTLSYSATTGYIDKITETVNGVSVETTISLDENNSIKQIAKSDNTNVNFDYAEGKTGYVVKAVYQSNGIGYYFDCGLGEYEELHLLSTTDGIEGGSVKELTPATSGDYVTVNNVNCPIQRLYDVDSGERWARVINEKTNEKVLYTFDYFGNCVSVIEENYDVSGTKTPQAKSFTKTGKYLDLSVSRELNLFEHLSHATTTANSITDFSQFDTTDLYIMNPFKTALESKTDSDRKIYYSDEGKILFTINKDHLASTIIESATTGLAVSAWVKADSLPVEPIATGLQVNDVAEEFSYNTTVAPQDLPGLVNKRFDLCAKVIFYKGDPKIFRNSFDWTRKDFQYTETYVILDDVEWANVKEIEVYVDYSNNNGRIYMYGGAMIFGNLSLSFRNEKLQTVLQESSDGKLSTTYTYENNKVVAEKTFTKNFGSDNEEKPFIYTVDNSYEYDNKGNVKKVIDNKNGLITEYTYSAFGDVLSTKVSHPDLTNTDNQTLEILNEVVYNEIGDVKEVKNEFGEIIGTYTYAHNAVSKIKDFNNSETVFGYDTTYSLLTSVQSTVSDTLNKNSTEFTAGTPIKDTDVASDDTSGNTTIEYDYDGFGNVTAIYVNGSLYCSIEYKNNYNKKTVTYANGDILIYNQDIDNGVEFSRYYTRDPKKQGSTEFEMKFDSFGRFKDLETEDMGGTKIAQKYNEDGTTRKSYVECEDDIFYDLSRETEYGDDRKVSKQTIRHKDGNSEYIVDEIKPKYDDNDIVTEINHKDVFREGLNYDKLNRVTDTTKYTIVKDEDDQPIATGGFVKKYGYKTVNNKTSQLISEEQFVKVDEQGNETIEETLNYVYDALGRVVEIWKTVGETETLIKKYTYDGLSRLVREDNGDIGTTYTYSYDNAGNILSTYSYPFTTGDLSGVTGFHTKSFSYSNGKLVEYHGDEYETNIPYDANGNPTSYYYFPMTWSHGHRLDSYANQSYKYNYAGLRTQKIETSDGLQRITKFALEGDKIIAQENPDGTTILFYYGLDGLTALEYDGNMYYYKKNIFGDIIGIYDSQRNIVARYQYDAWGNCRIVNEDGVQVSLASGIAGLNPFRYRGYYLDSETGLYYLNARYYNPKRARFISPTNIDALNPTTINGLNLYAYCCNNPVSFTSIKSSSEFNLYATSTQKVGHTGFLNQVLVDKSFNKGVFFGSWTITGLKTSKETKNEISLRDKKFNLGASGSFSLFNERFQIGIGNEDINASLVAEGDFATVSGMIGAFIDPTEDIYFVGLEASATLFSAKGGIQFELFGKQIEVGGSINALSAKFQLGAGVRDGKFYFKHGASQLIGFDVYIIIELW